MVVGVAAVVVVAAVDEEDPESATATNDTDLDISVSTLPDTDSKEDILETILGLEIVDETDDADDMRALARRLVEARRPA